MQKLQTEAAGLSAVMRRDIRVSKPRMTSPKYHRNSIFKDDEMFPRYTFRHSHEKFIRFLLINPTIDTILNRMPDLGLSDWWLSSGCLFQTVWNLRVGRPVTEGISDYDIIYFSDDLSWEAENEVINNCSTLFEDLPVYIEARNQARVHLWYKEKFGVEYSPLKNATHSLWRYPSRTSAIAITKGEDDVYHLSAPFGVEHALAMRVEPNRRTKANVVYSAKAERWKREWPSLRVSIPEQ